MLAVEEFYPIEEAAQLPPVPREVAGGGRDGRRRPGVVRVRGVNRVAGGAPVAQRPGVVAAQDVVGDAEDIEAGRSVEVDQRSERKLAVAPGRVGVELAE